MPERKAWTEQEDRILKFLREDEHEHKWSTIARKMQSEYNMIGRSGKQCRERYHNHLDSKIVHSEWTLEQERTLFQMQEEIGNKWAIISSKLPGRTDNCVKNHFYSKLRKGLRKLNKTILKNFRRDFREVKTVTLYKIIEAMESKFKSNMSLENEESDKCFDIKRRLCIYQDGQQLVGMQEKQMEFAKQLIFDINQFANSLKKEPKKAKRPRKSSEQEYVLLHPKMCLSRKSSREDSSSSYSDCLSSSNMSISNEDEEENFEQKSSNDKLLRSCRLQRTKSNDSLSSSRPSSKNKQNSLKPPKNSLSRSVEIKREEVQPESKQDQKQVMQRQKSSSSEEFGGKRQMQAINMFYEDSHFMMRVISPKVTRQEMLQINDGLFLMQDQKQMEPFMKIQGQGLDYFNIQ